MWDERSGREPTLVNAALNSLSFKCEGNCSALLLDRVTFKIEFSPNTGALGKEVII